MKIAVLGGNGQLGEDICAAFLAKGDATTSLTHADVSIESSDSLRQALDRIGPDVVVNTAAFHNVEKCEAEPEKAFAVNARGVRNVAQVSAELKAKLFHISTDYVFDGAKQSPYLEQDAPLPLNVYGNSKLAGEYFARSTNPRHFVVRVSAIYGQHPCRAKGGLNFIELMLKLSKERDQLRVVADEYVSPTPTKEIASQIVALSKTSDYGLFHATCEGSCSWYEFAKAIFEITGTQVRLEQAKPGEFAAKVARPKYSVLENAELKRKGLNRFNHWKEGLEGYLAHRAQPVHPRAV